MIRVRNDASTEKVSVDTWLRKPKLWLRQPDVWYSRPSHQVKSIDRSVKRTVWLLAATHIFRDYLCFNSGTVRQANLKIRIASARPHTGQCQGVYHIVAAIIYLIYRPISAPIRNEVFSSIFQGKFIKKYIIRFTHFVNLSQIRMTKWIIRRLCGLTRSCEESYILLRVQEAINSDRNQAEASQQF